MNVLAREHFHSDGKCGVDGHARLCRPCRGWTGAVVRSADSWSKGAMRVTLFLAFESTFAQADPPATCRAELAAAAARPYAELKQRHVADHQALFRRVAIDLGDSPHPDWPLDLRLAAVQAGVDDPALAALLFQFGRYLLIGSSRPDSPLPAHLTGVWNDNVACRIGWTCDYHLDINTQMNYWIAELTGISECHVAAAALDRRAFGAGGPAYSTHALRFARLGGAHLLQCLELHRSRLEHLVGDAPDRRRLGCHTPVGSLRVYRRS